MDIGSAKVAKLFGVLRLPGGAVATLKRKAGEGEEAGEGAEGEDGGIGGGDIINELWAFA